MINFIEEQRGNLRIVSDSGTKYLPVSPDWTLLGFDQGTLCLDYGNGTIGLFTENGDKIKQCYLDPQRNAVRNYTNGNVYFKDTQMGINYRLDVLNEQRHQMV